MNKTAAGARAKAIALGLRRHKDFDTMTEARFESIYNGIGPDQWPEALRALMTFIYRNFRALPAVHDVDFSYSDGTRATWAVVTDNWRYNMIVCLNDRYPIHKPWLWPLRAIAYAKLWASYEALKSFSFSVWEEAKAK